jgi:hypothetical protein
MTCQKLIRPTIPLRRSMETTSWQNRITLITFTRIASTDTEIPNQPGSNFLHFGTFPSVDKQGEVAFGESINQFGNIAAIYVGSGGELQLVADVNTVLPGDPGQIANLAEPVIGNGVVAFIPSGGVVGRFGVYTWEAASINVIVDHTTVLPDGGQLIGLAETPAIDEKGNVAFYGVTTAPDHGGVFKFVNGELTEFSGVRLEFGPGPSISHGHVAVIGGGGILIDDDLVVDGTTIAPDGGTFLAIGPGPDISGNAVAFLALTSNGGGGVFVTRAGHLTQVVDGSTGAQQPNIDHNKVAFIGTGIDPEGKQGIYVSVGNHLDTVIEAGDILDGRTVASVQMSFSALSGQYLAFEADFTDGSSGIYRANLHGHAEAGADSLGDTSGLGSTPLDDFYLI